MNITIFCKAIPTHDNFLKLLQHCDENRIELYVNEIQSTILLKGINFSEIGVNGLARLIGPLMNFVTLSQNEVRLSGFEILQKTGHPGIKIPIFPHHDYYVGDFNFRFPPVARRMLFYLSSTGKIKFNFGDILKFDTIPKEFQGLGYDESKPFYGVIADLLYADWYDGVGIAVKIIPLGKQMDERRLCRLKEDNENFWSVNDWKSFFANVLNLSDAKLMPLDDVKNSAEIIDCVNSSIYYRISAIQPSTCIF